MARAKNSNPPFFPTSSHVCVSIGRAEGAAAPPEQQRLPPPAVGERRQRPQQRRRLSAAAAAGESRGHATKSRRREKRTDGRREKTLSHYYNVRSFRFCSNKGGKWRGEGGSCGGSVAQERGKITVISIRPFLPSPPCTQAAMRKKPLLPEKQAGRGEEGGLSGSQARMGFFLRRRRWKEDFRTQHRRQRERNLRRKGRGDFWELAAVFLRALLRLCHGRTQSRLDHRQSAFSGVGRKKGARILTRL